MELSLVLFILVMLLLALFVSGRSARRIRWHWFAQG
jgi:hypothetical protein